MQQIIPEFSVREQNFILRFIQQNITSKGYYYIGVSLTNIVDINDNDINALFILNEVKSMTLDNKINSDINQLYKFHQLFSNPYLLLLSFSFIKYRLSQKLIEDPQNVRIKISMQEINNITSLIKQLRPLLKNYDIVRVIK